MDIFKIPSVRYVVLSIAVSVFLVSGCFVLFGYLVLDDLEKLLEEWPAAKRPSHMMIPGTGLSRVVALSGKTISVRVQLLDPVHLLPRDCEEEEIGEMTCLCLRRDLINSCLVASSLDEDYLGLEGARVFERIDELSKELEARCTKD